MPWFGLGTHRAQRLHRIRLMLVKITKQPSGNLDGMELRRYLAGQQYNVSAAMGEYLVLNGFALVEVRGKQRSHRERSERRRPRK